MYTELKSCEFFQKFYKDDLQDLLDKGNKWFKICGYVDIPNKQIKNN